MAAATAQLASFETGHGDMVHDAAFDYYGKRLATCSSDRSIKVFDVVGEQVRGPRPHLERNALLPPCRHRLPGCGPLASHCFMCWKRIIFPKRRSHTWQISTVTRGLCGRSRGRIPSLAASSRRAALTAASSFGRRCRTMCGSRCAAARALRVL